MELFRENLDTDRQQQLEAIIGGVGARIQDFQRQQHTQYQVECLTDMVVGVIEGVGRVSQIGCRGHWRGRGEDPRFP